MKQLFIFLAAMTISAFAFANSNCGGDLHPKAKAECLLKQLIADKSNSEINSQVELFTKDGLQASTEVSSTFVGGACVALSKCTYRYIVSTDYYSLAAFKNVVLLIEASNDGTLPNLKRVLSQSEL